MKFLIINGPNLNLLGRREPGIYGKSSYADLCTLIEKYARDHGSTVRCFQSNHEGAIIDRIQEAYSDGTEGIVINPGAYTHAHAFDGGQRGADQAGGHGRGRVVHANAPDPVGLL